MTRRIVGGMMAAGAIALAHAATAQAAPTGPVSLAGFEFRLDGAAASETLGGSVASAGDVNGDGYDDVIVGSGRSGTSQNGAAYVIYGKATGTRATPSAAAPNLGAADGFRIEGFPNEAQAGNSVAGAGDVNGDGLADVIVGAPYEDTGSQDNAGAAYVIYGRSTARDAIDVSDSNGPNNPGDGLLAADGVRLAGTNDSQYVGWSVGGAHDVNGDGKDDIVIGSPYAGLGFRGAVYVIYGQQGGPVALPLDNNGIPQSQGFQINGTGDFAGWSVDGPGDVNDDEPDDLLVGAPHAGANGRSNSGSAYVLYGKQGTSRGTVDLADTNGPGATGIGIDSADGYRIDGATGSSLSSPLSSELGTSVAGAGDVNGDGIPDVIAGSRDSTNGRFASGAAYVIYGAAGPRGAIDVADTNGTGTPGQGVEASLGFGIEGAKENGAAVMISVGAAGDINGDGDDDVIVGTPGNDDSRGAAHVVYGGRSDGRIDLADTNGSATGTGIDPADGFRIDAAADDDQAGWSVAGAGDTDNDGDPDLIVSAVTAGNNARQASGSAYIVDLNPPAAPAIGAPGAGPVRASAFTLSGTAEPGSTVELFDGTASLGTTTADSNGAWSKPLTGVANGQHTYTATAADTAGNISPASAAAQVTVDVPAAGSAPASPAAPAPAPRDTIAPVLSQPKLSATRFAVNTKAAASARRPRGTRLTFSLSEPATVIVVTQQPVRGRWRTIRTAGYRLPAGKASIRYSGKIKPRGRTRSLKPGRYRLKIRPSDPAGNKGRLTTLRFTVVR